MSWDDYNCGGYPSIKLENPDGTHCETSEMSLDAGDTMVWSMTEGDLKNCSNMVVNKNTNLYITTSSGGDFCPKNVLVTPVEGPEYTTNEINDWYDRHKTNNKKHTLQESKEARNNFLRAKVHRSSRSMVDLPFLFFPFSFSLPVNLFNLVN